MNPSKSIPEGVETVSAEGADLAAAVAAAAESIGIEPRRVEFKLDLAHFRSSLGTSVAKNTVKIVAWNTTKSDEELEAAATKSAPKKRARSERRDDDRKDDGRRDDRKKRRSRKKDDDEGAEREPAERKSAPEATDLEDTEASDFAKAWFTELMTMMSLEGEVKSAGNDERVQIWVSADKAGRLIGKRGSTLGSIRHLLGLAVTKKFGDLTIDVDVEDNRPKRDSDGGGRKERRGKRSRDHDRKPRNNGGDRERSRYPEAKLRALARRAAEKALDSDKTITINLELNSYDRRIVHMEVAEVEGVNSRSEERDDGVKIIQVFPEED